MDRRKQVLEIADEKGLIRASDLASAGISRTYLYMLTAEGMLERVAHGLYSLPNAEVDAYIGLSEVAKRLPKAVIALVSALHFHELTTQIPNEVWVCMPRGTWVPEIEYPRLNVVQVSKKAYDFGIEMHELNGVKVRIYDVEKTVADCFKFRNKIGLDVAIEALQDAWRSRRLTVDGLMAAARIDRVDRVIRPYLEAIA